VLIVRILVLAAMAVMIAAVGAYLVSGRRKYLLFAFGLFKVSLMVILAFLLLLAADRAIELWRS
jgi:hypothetical protein